MLRHDFSEQVSRILTVQNDMDQMRRARDEIMVAPAFVISPLIVATVHEIVKTTDPHKYTKDLFCPFPSFWVEWLDQMPGQAGRAGRHGLFVRTSHDNPKAGEVSHYWRQNSPVAGAIMSTGAAQFDFRGDNFTAPRISTEERRMSEALPDWSQLFSAICALFALINTPRASIITTPGNPRKYGMRVLPNEKWSEITLSPDFAAELTLSPRRTGDGISLHHVWKGGAMPAARIIRGEADG